MAQAFNSLSSRNKFAKRHYEAIALAMQHAHPGAGDNRAVIQWSETCKDLAEMFERDNSEFKRDRFMWACEPGANVRARTNGGAR